MTLPSGLTAKSRPEPMASAREPDSSGIIVGSGKIHPALSRRIAQTVPSDLVASVSCSPAVIDITDERPATSCGVVGPGVGPFTSLGCPQDQSVPSERTAYETPATTAVLGNWKYAEL